MSTALIYVPFASQVYRITHKRVLVTLVEDLPQFTLTEQDGWKNLLAIYLGHLPPSEVFEECTVSSSEVMNYFLNSA